MRINDSFDLIEIASALVDRLHREDYRQTADEAQYDEFTYDEDLIPALRIAQALRDIIAQNEHWL
jgi:NADP-dependent 3-hydroxy acid dehydrogenase YdfG